MYADRHASSSGIDPRSLGIAVALNGVAITALLLTQPVFTVIRHDKPLITYQVPTPRLPDEVPKPAPQHPLQHPIFSSHPLIETPIKTEALTPTDPPSPSSSVEVGPIVMPSATPTPALVTIAPEVDPAHRSDLQPIYPATELRAEREGSVIVRVLIGTDGRVHQVEQVSATSDAFFRATQDRALARWRFRPATRGGVPVEAWRTMSIRFVIPR